MLLDKNNIIIAGNKTQEAAIKAGIRKVRVVETTGDELVAVRRIDVDIDTKKGRELAFVDNLSTQVSLAWDTEQLEAVQADVEGFEVSDFGFNLYDDEEKEPKEHEDISGQVKSLYQIAIDCEDESEQERIYNELKDKYKCRVLTL